MKNNTLSVVLAVYNEENNLPDCLESVKNLVDEMVVVDGGSTDKSVKIAQKYGAKVIETDNPPIFHINKNKAIKAATSDWVLQLDADERVTPSLAKEIKTIINSGSKLNGFWIPRRNFFLKRFLKKGGQYPDFTMRLYRRGKGQLPARDVHEQAKVLGEVGYLRNDLLHLRDTNLAKYLEGLDRYTNLLALQMKEGKMAKNPLQFLNYFFVKPLVWFISTYLRHKGFMDGTAGFIFSFFSALRFPIAYFKYLKTLL